MPAFAFVAKNRSGTEERGFINGQSAGEVLGSLHARGLIVINLAEDRQLSARDSALQRFLKMEVIPTRVGVRDTALFMRQLATMIAAGIPLVRGLRGLSVDTPNAALRTITAKMADTIDRGEQLSVAMAEHPRAFSPLAVSMVKAGEAAGTLDVVLDQLATYLEKVDALRSKVRAAMSYPVFVLMFAITAFLILLIKIVPTFEKIYADFGAKLPAPTIMVIATSNWLRANFVLAGLIALFAAILLILWVRGAGGRYIFDGFLIKVPIFGPIIRGAVVARFARTFGVLLGSGLPVLRALDLAREAAGNTYFANRVARARREIEDGREISESFRKTKALPEVVLQLMSTGEETGQLTPMLLKSADFYDRQVETAVSGLTALIEPLLIVLVGLIVAVIVITMFLPIFHLGDAVFWSEFKKQ